MIDQKDIYTLEAPEDDADKGSVVAAEPIKPEAPSKEPEASKPKSSARWSKKPSTVGQLAELPDTVKQDKIYAITFKLDDKANGAKAGAYGELMARMLPATSPEAVILSENIEFYQGGWYILVRYATLLYQVI